MITEEALTELAMLSPEELRGRLIGLGRSSKGWLALYMIWNLGRAWGMEHVMKMNGMTKAQAREFFQQVDAGANPYQLLGMTEGGDHHSDLQHDLPK